jgi:hypothetical protein
MNEAVMALFNIRHPFGVTPKGGSRKLGVRYIIPQLLLVVLSLAAVAYKMG